jgi:hypothetical protein
MRLVLTGDAAASPPMQSFPRYLEHLERYVAQRSGSQRCGKPEPGNVSAHCFALFGGPIRD